MDAWVVDQPGPIDGGPLVRVTREPPEPAAGEVRVRVRACGVCRTDLHLAEGDLAPRRSRAVPGHEAVGRVVAAGPEIALPRTTLLSSATPSGPAAPSSPAPGEEWSGTAPASRAGRLSGTVPGRAQAASGTAKPEVGRRVGVAWLRSTCGRCRYCR